MTEQELPKIDFNTFVLSIASAAFMGLGLQPPGMPEGAAESSKVDLPMAKQNIDLLELLEEKTQGNLTDDEKNLLNQLLREIRVRYVELNQA